MLDAPPAAAPMIARFELAFLGELGFGLDLAPCAVDRHEGRSRLRFAAFGPRGVARGRRPWRDN